MTYAFVVQVEAYFMERGKQKTAVRRMSDEEKAELVRVCKDWAKGISFSRLSPVYTGR